MHSPYGRWSEASRCGRPPPRKLLLAVTALALAFTVMVRADPSAENIDDARTAGPRPTPSDPQTQGRARFIDPVDGKFDFSAFLAQPHAFLPIPVIVTEPAVGYGGGVFGAFLRPREHAGSEGWSRPNISVIGGVYPGWQFLVSALTPRRLIPVQSRRTTCRGSGGDRY